MDVLPVDIAEEMKECALSAGKSTTEERFGRKGEADANKVGWNEHAESFTEKSDGLLSPEICADIKTMFWYQAWRTANERKGYRSDAARDIKKVDEMFEQLVGRGEMSQKLANHVKDMGWNIAWWCANTKVGYDDDAVIRYFTGKALAIHVYVQRVLLISFRLLSFRLLRCISLTLPT